MGKVGKTTLGSGVSLNNATVDNEALAASLTTTAITRAAANGTGRFRVDHSANGTTSVETRATDKADLRLTDAGGEPRRAVAKETAMRSATNFARRAVDRFTACGAKGASPGKTRVAVLITRTVNGRRRRRGFADWKRCVVADQRGASDKEGENGKGKMFHNTTFAD